MSKTEETPQVKKFKLVLKKIPVEIEDADGRTNNCMLKELTGKQRNDYLTKSSKKVVVSKAGEVKSSDFSGMCSDLLSLCLYTPDDNLITAAEIDGWPAEMQMALYEMAVGLSGLNKKGEDEAKKD
jgi:hypothetical protein